MMPDPVRWRDGATDAPEGARAWLEGVARPGPLPDEARARVVAMASSAVGAKAGAAWLGVKGIVAVGVLGVAAVTARAVLVAPPREAPRAVGSVAPSRGVHAPSARASSRVALPAAPALASPVVAPVRAAPVVPPPVAPPRPLHATRVASIAAPPTLETLAPSPPPAPVENALTREANAVGALRALLERDPTAVLSAADAIAREFPDGAMAPDREFYAYEALRRLGRAADARARGERLVARFPGTAEAARVARMLARDE